MAEALTGALANLVTLEHLLHLGFGVLLGLTVGVFPGLGGIVGLSLLMPFLYGMDTVAALATLVGLVAVIPTSDTFTSVLMGIPGSSASQATVLDGFPLAQQGQAARALAAAFSASLLGGLVGAVVLTLFVQVARPLILTFGSAELFMLALLGLSMVGVLSTGGLVKGLAACGLGLVIGSIGSAPATGEFRITFGIDYLYDGFPLVIMGIGIFAFPEIIDLLRKNRAIAASGQVAGNWLDGLRDVARNWFLCLRCAGIGTLIGAIPGLGGTVVDWIAYGHVVQSSKDKSQFGKGDIRGVIAPESANNAKEGGGLVPTLLFGIPGSGSMAVFLGGMVLIGIEAGPAMVSTDLPLTYTIIWSLALANVLGAGLCLLLAKPIARLTTIPFYFLAPFMIIVINFAAFQATRDFMDLVALFCVGLLGVFLKRFGWSRPAFLIGFVLAPQAEGYLNLAVQFYGWSMLSRPGVLIILVVTIVSVWLGSRNAIEKPSMSRKSGPAQTVKSKVLSRQPQIWFIGAILLLLGYAIGSSLQQSPLGAIFPVAVAAVTVFLCTCLLGTLIAGPVKSPVNYDLERILSNDPRNTGIWANIFWFAALIAASGVLGFFVAALGFLFVFVRVKTPASWKKTFGLVICATAVLWLLESFLAIEFPVGLLQIYVDVPI